MATPDILTSVDPVAGEQALPVVGAAIVRGGLLLVAQRDHPPALAGRWELPGGKVDDGESDPDALVRECREELGCEVVVGERVGPAVTTADGRFVLRAHACTLAPGSAEPRAGEHRAIAWADVAALEELDWLPADLPLVPHLTALLA